MILSARQPWTRVLGTLPIAPKIQADSSGQHFDQHCNVMPLHVSTYRYAAGLEWVKPSATRLEHVKAFLASTATCMLKQTPSTVPQGLPHMCTAAKYYPKIPMGPGPLISICDNYLMYVAELPGGTV